MGHYERMWTFETERFLVAWDITPCDYLDLSWDDTGEVREGLESGHYVAFDSRVAVYLDGQMIGADYLGQSIYADPADFRDVGGYFGDMVREAVREAREALRSLKDIHVREAA
ncbi:hypothetical protein GTQ45_02050 [Pyruvatibacter mobilis]|uniref:Uncharacterized protein n=1 Tax=Pyruvatibacter mobilis TaxID=1712261 RepID=A0A845Q7U4_9HYPH|nr:hypothetical protein [Pyruvatibacter mobilis]NBG94514.1 hypothetical protein [Pyruvatibacter mobilis]QJD74034.1 hypothetical protein HG718_00600 [Pyruvatibacter mobilis]GGD03547.1 hypothetical protein GCM10011587_04100 [Pyruvatibacter mobilis]